jgi:type II secretory pathway component PulF
MTGPEINLPESKKANASKSVFTWLATILACAYFIWTGIFLYHSTPAFTALFSSIGVDIPLSTRIVIRTYRFLYPALFGGMTVLMILKQFFVREKWASLSITFMATVLAGLASDEIVRALYHPINDLVEKVGK